MVRVQIQISDFVQAFEIPVEQLPTSLIPTTPPALGLPEAPAPTVPTTKVVKITTLQTAFRTQEVPILVTATCTNPPAPINGEDVSLLIDGKVVETKTVIKGTASFSYVFKESGLHKIHVTIPRSSSCTSDGSSSVEIDITSEIPPTLERLRLEREALERKETEISTAREEIRKIVGGII